jgi:hypothetical protein
MASVSEAQRNLLQSIQYKAAKIILRTKINIPISTKTFDFEWLNFRFHLQAKS